MAKLDSIHPDLRHRGRPDRHSVVHVFLLRVFPHVMSLPRSSLGEYGYRVKDPVVL
jgi:hypothetical protein